MRLYQNKSINLALRIPLNRGNKLFSRFSVMLPLTNGVHYKDVYLKNDDEARSSIVRAAELGVINSCDILPVYQEFKSPSHEEFAKPTRWSLMNALTETIKKYSPQRVDYSYRALNRAFGLDGWQATIFAN